MRKSLKYRNWNRKYSEKRQKFPAIMLAQSRVPVKTYYVMVSLWQR